MFTKQFRCTNCGTTRSEDRQPGMQLCKQCYRKMKESMGITEEPEEQQEEQNEQEGLEEGM